MGRELDLDDVAADHPKAEKELRDLRRALRGCRDMLAESAEQFRRSGDNGFAATCENHIVVADIALDT